jgi:hypothetical protein
MVDVVTGIYQGRPYEARLTDGGVWVVRTDGPVIVFPALTGEEALSIREEVERLFDALLGPVLPQASALPCTEASPRPDTACIETYRHGVSAEPSAGGPATSNRV